MPSFSKNSLKLLATCDEKLQTLMKEVIKDYDFTVICGTRGEADQDAAYKAGNSKLKFPNSKHNSNPSKAVDIAPYPIDWNNVGRFKQLAQEVLRTAERLGIDIRWGGDFNCNGKEDDSFVDLPHFELR